MRPISRGAAAAVVFLGLTSLLAGCSGVTCNDITWTGLENVRGAPGTIIKISGGDDWNAGAVSESQIAAGDVYVEVLVDRNTDFKMFGLSSSNTTSHFRDIDYAIDLQGDRTTSVWENGTHVAEAGGSTYAAGDVFKVAIESGVVNYYRNEAVFYTSKKPPTYPVFVDASIWTQGGQLTARICAP